MPPRSQDFVRQRLTTALRDLREAEETMDVEDYEEFCLRYDTGSPWLNDLLREFVVRHTIHRDDAFISYVLRDTRTVQRVLDEMFGTTPDTRIEDANRRIREMWAQGPVGVPWTGMLNTLPDVGRASATDEMPWSEDLDDSEENRRSVLPAEWQRPAVDSAALADIDWQQQPDVEETERSAMFFLERLLDAMPKCTVFTHRGPPRVAVRPTNQGVRMPWGRAPGMAMCRACAEQQAYRVDETREISCADVIIAAEDWLIARKRERNDCDPPPANAVQRPPGTPQKPTVYTIARTQAEVLGPQRQQETRPK